MSLNIRAKFEPSRSLAFGSINGSTFTAMGTPFANAARIVHLYNQTDAPLQYSFDGVNPHIVLPPAGHIQLNFTTNSTMTSEGFQLSAQTVVSVRSVSTASSGSAYASMVYAQR